MMGGRMDKGGLVLDFLFSNPPDLAVNVQGVYYHYEFGVETKANLYVNIDVPQEHVKVELLHNLVPVMHRRK